MPSQLTEVPVFLAQSAVFRGWALAEQGQRRGARADTPRLSGLPGHRDGDMAAVFLALLAETYGKVGQAEKGLSAVSEALTLVNKTGERVCEAELYRLKGELTLPKGSRGLELGARSTSPKPPEVSSPNPKGGAGSRSVFPQSHRDCPQATGQVLELRAVMSLAACGSTGQADRSSPAVIRDLRLVHRRV